MQMIITLVMESTADLKVFTASGGVNAGYLLPLLDAAVARMSPPGADSVHNITALQATDATVTAFVTVPLRSRTDVEHWESLSPPEIRRMLYEEGLAHLVWAGLSKHQVLAWPVDSGDSYYLPMVTLLAMGGVSVGLVVVCLALDALRSSTSMLFGKRESPAHLDFVLPLVAVPSLVTSVWCTLTSLPQTMMYVSAACLGAALVFNVAASFMFHMRMARTLGASRRGAEHGATEGLLGAAGRGGGNSKGWILHVSGIAGVANVGSLKLVASDVAEPFRLPESTPVMVKLSACGLVGAALGDLPQIILLVAAQPQLVPEERWSELAVASATLSALVVLVSVASVLRNLARRHPGEKKQFQLSLSSRASSPDSSLCSSPVNIAESRCSDTETCKVPGMTMRQCFSVNPEEL